MGRKELPESKKRRPYAGKMAPDLYKRLKARAKAEAKAQGRPPSVSRVIEKAVERYLRTPLSSD
ncbi:MAG: hypothetical protein KDB68_00720 [Planctomycetes bacterium]|nr:hypothetical protein [Planctomycetota bacterium]MCA8934701.1 hypothetical protein [Planctomycetota bacterium]